MRSNGIRNSLVWRGLAWSVRGIILSVAGDATFPNTRSWRNGPRAFWPGRLKPHLSLLARTETYKASTIGVLGLKEMRTETNGAHCSAVVEERLNVFALVIYIPDPLGRFLDDLRRDLVPSCRPHAHVSVLPPRPLAVDWQVAGQQVRTCADAWAPFEIELGPIRMFPVTNVIYIELSRGA